MGHSRGACWESFTLHQWQNRVFVGKGSSTDGRSKQPAFIFRRIGKYDKAESSGSLQKSRKYFPKSMPNRDPNGQSAAWPWNWNKKTVDTALKRLPPKHSGKRKRSGVASNQPAEEASIKPEPFLAGLSFVFIGSLYKSTLEEAQELVRRHGGEVTFAPSTRTSYVVLGLDAAPRKQQIVQDSQLKTLKEREFYNLIRSMTGSTQAVEKLADGSDPNYLIRVDLDDTAFPAIHRVLSCPVWLDFYDFGSAI